MGSLVNWNVTFVLSMVACPIASLPSFSLTEKINLQSPRSKGSIEAGYLSSIEYLVLNNESICLWRAML